MSIDQIFREVNNLGGFCLPAHVDKPTCSILSSLALFPDYLEIPAVEITPRIAKDFNIDNYKLLYGKQIITSSDAHFLSEIGQGQTILDMEKLNFQELILALKNISKRCVRGFKSYYKSPLEN